MEKNKAGKGSEHMGNSLLQGGQEKAAQGRCPLSRDPRTRARPWEVQTGSELGAPVEKIEKRVKRLQGVNEATHVTGSPPCLVGRWGKSRSWQLVNRPWWDGVLVCGRLQGGEGWAGRGWAENGVGGSL